MIDTNKLFTIIIEAGLIIAGLTLLAQSIRSFIKGKKIKALAILFLAIGIFIDSFTTYSQISGLNHFLPELANQVILVIESLCFVAGSVILIIFNILHL